jgi:hypothetical protein
MPPGWETQTQYSCGTSIDGGVTFAKPVSTKTT